MNTNVSRNIRIAGMRIEYIFSDGANECGTGRANIRVCIPLIDWSCRDNLLPMLANLYAVCTHAQPFPACQLR